MKRSGPSWAAIGDSIMAKLARLTKRIPGHHTMWFPSSVRALRLDEIAQNSGYSVSNTGIHEENATVEEWCLFLSEYNQYGQRVYYDIIPGTCWEVQVR